jgi:hypothetical protein
MNKLYKHIVYLILIVLGAYSFSFLMTVKAVAPVAQVVEVTNSTETATSGGEIRVPQRSEYVLPYPGILHNHPLYVLKELRDKIIEILIVDPIRKSDFYLLQSDKWINSISLLLVKNEKELAQKVLSQSTERMKMAVNQLTTIQKEGREIPSGAIEKMNGAIEKHLEVIDELSIKKEIETNDSRQSYLAIQEELMKLKK